MCSYKKLVVQSSCRKQENIQGNSVKKFIVLLFTFGMFGFLAACASTSEKQGIQPTEGKLTFAFFYTDG